MKKIILILSAFFLITAFRTGDGNRLPESAYKIYSSKLEKEVTLDTIVNSFKNYDIILFGEEHNDSVAHHLQTKLLEKSFEKYGKSIVLSMEMFERDAQPVLDEYLNGYIKENHFKKDARAWSNYRDYRPMVEFSKSNGLTIVAANASMRYVSLANRKGQKELENLSPVAKTWLAPLPYDTAKGEYYEKLREIMGYNASLNTHKDSSKTPSQSMQSMMPKSLCGHSLWDATMAYSISEVFKKSPKAKIIHLNGRFHSDDYFGIYQQLQKYAKGKKVLVISTVNDKDYPSINYKNYKGLADFIIFPDQNIPKTYKDR